MKFTAAATTLLLAASTASALATPWLDSLTGASSSKSQATLADEPMPVSGDNPLFYCAAPKEYILDIDYIDLSPNPPLALVSSLCICSIPYLQFIYETLLTQ